jgi:hypothetical protein
VRNAALAAWAQALVQRWHQLEPPQQAAALLLGGVSLYLLSKLALLLAVGVEAALVAGLVGAEQLVIRGGVLVRCAHRPASCRPPQQVDVQTRVGVPKSA